MSTAAGPAPPPSLLGYSRGRWEGETLVVETDRIDAPYFNADGVPLGKEARILERFWVTDGGRRLSYTLTVTDAETFMEPVEAKRAWVAREGVELLPYDCNVSAPR